MALLEVKNLTKEYPIYRGVLRKQVGAVFALNGVDLTIKEGEFVAVVGESGCGKSTLAKAVIRLIDPTGGTIIFDGKETLDRKDRRKIQMVFQDPFSSLDPRKKVRDALIEPLLYHEPKMGRDEAIHRAKEVLQNVGLSPDALNKFPHQFSGGQQQRIAIGRAIILSPN